MSKIVGEEGWSGLGSPVCVCMKFECMYGCVEEHVYNGTGVDFKGHLQESILFLHHVVSRD